VYHAYGISPGRNIFENEFHFTAFGLHNFSQHGVLQKSLVVFKDAYADVALRFLNALNNYFKLRLRHSVAAGQRHCQ